MAHSGQVVTLLAHWAVGQAKRRSSKAPRAQGWTRWLRDPRSAVFLVLALGFFVGGGRRLLQGWRAREAVARLNDPDISPEEIVASTTHRRAGLIDYFRLLGTAESEARRTAAGRALAALWARDDLIAEEEKALVRRGFAVTWTARRRYPRALGAALPIAVHYGVPFLRDLPGEVGPGHLEWSHRISGANRAALETYSAWKGGPGLAEFTLIPGDFETDGPHRLVLQARVRTVGLTESWEFELPAIPFAFEFDPRLAVDALLALADSGRAEAFRRSVRVEPETASSEAGLSAFLVLNDELALRPPPRLVVSTPLPCDLAHTVALEFEGVPGRFEAGPIVLSGQGETREAHVSTRTITLGPLAGPGVMAIDRPGARRLRAVLTPDPNLGWADPEVRSIWPGTIETDWVEVRVIRQ